MKKNIIFLISIFILSFTPKVFSFNLSISNPKINLKVDPGEVITGSLTINNPSSSEIAIKAYLEDFIYVAPYDGSKKFFPAGSTEHSCAGWISFSPSEFKLGPFGQRNIDYTVRMPQSASGGYYAVLFFETSLGEIEQTPGNRLLVLGRIGSLFLVETKNSIKKAEIEDLKAGINSIRAQFKDTGNILLKAHGTYFIMDTGGMVRDRGEIGDIFIFPGNETLFSIKMAPSLGADKYTLIINFDLQDGDVLVKEIDLMKHTDGSLEISAVRD